MPNVKIIIFDNLSENSTFFNNSLTCNINNYFFCIDCYKMLLLNEFYYHNVSNHYLIQGELLKEDVFLLGLLLKIGFREKNQGNVKKNKFFVNIEFINNPKTSKVAKIEYLKIDVFIFCILCTKFEIFFF